MEVKQARFITSNTSVSKCPKPDRPEYAFIGRSNVGKSSLINMLVNSKSLAKTSSRPGKTQLINHFLINETWYLVDLPGYGYAQAPKTEVKKWEKFIREYILKRENLYCLFVLVDIRHDPLPVDLEFIEWLGSHQVPFALIFTKSDKLKTEEIEPNIQKYKDKLLEKWESLPEIFVSSAEKFTGKEEILSYIGNINQSA
ncbi:MAG: ribosome biogenesis GTP-binding protein YihA/YsxC [Bacteroidota bacterium]